MAASDGTAVAAWLLAAIRIAAVVGVRIGATLVVGLGYSFSAAVNCIRSVAVTASAG